MKFNFQNHFKGFKLFFYPSERLMLNIIKNLRKIIILYSHITGNCALLPENNLRFDSDKMSKEDSTYKCRRYKVCLGSVVKIKETSK